MNDAYIIHIGKWLTESPDWYRNFYRYLDKLHPYWDTNSFESELRKYNASPYYPNEVIGHEVPDLYLKFDTESDATIFILKFT